MIYRPEILKEEIFPITEYPVPTADCCAQQRTYEKFFGLMAQRFFLLPSGPLALQRRLDARFRPWQLRS